VHICKKLERWASAVLTRTRDALVYGIAVRMAFAMAVTVGMSVSVTEPPRLLLTVREAYLYK
jgi:hypothetical protein